MSDPEISEIIALEETGTQTLRRALFLPDGAARNLLINMGFQLVNAYVDRVTEKLTNA